MGIIFSSKLDFWVVRMPTEKEGIVVVQLSLEKNAE